MFEEEEQAEESGKNIWQKTNSAPVDHSDVKSEDTIEKPKIEHPKSSSAFLHTE